MTYEPSLKPVIWVGSSRKDLREFPELVQDRMGYAPYVAQRGGKHRDAKALSGFGGAGVVEIVEDYRGDTFRAGLCVAVRQGGIRPARLPEEIEDRTLDAASGHGIDQATATRGGTDCWELKL
ncbi:MAG TPA: type II toxin-antitoxin system RelE/ParE family toxin [Terriglobales bacterium]|nr:type II toxin-antitoxin system RelE/ParE family toxin [Terriglobales bacterium]